MTNPFGTGIAELKVDDPTRGYMVTNTTDTDRQAMPTSRPLPVCTCFGVFSA